MSESMKNECDDLHFTVVYTYKLNVIKNATVMEGIFFVEIKLDTRENEIMAIDHVS